MQYRNFGNTDLEVSEVGFGAWGIGGPAMAGKIPIGWGKVDDSTSIAALKKAMDQGVNFYDTADFYGLGHSEELLGKVLGNRDDVVIASKAGHRLDEQQQIFVDYSGAYITAACEHSLRRLKREAIDFYQLHTARVKDLQQGDCLEALDTLQQQGKIRYWGVSLNTYSPEPEAEFLIEHQLGNGVQVVLNVINQRIISYLDDFRQAGMGIIARMPLQFGLLTGKFTPQTEFPPEDHRSFRLPPALLHSSLKALKPFQDVAQSLGMSQTALALSFILSFEQVSTVIPGIKTPEQALSNTQGVRPLPRETLAQFQAWFEEKGAKLLKKMQEAG